ncbi:MAG: membrane protein insertase YidC [Spirochaetes bacterium]|nr:membrane protein insertase YidC [Spirochaetota bacterium]
MEKNTLLAVVLSMVVIFGFYAIMGILHPPPEPVPVAPTAPEAPVAPVLAPPVVAPAAPLAPAVLEPLVQYEADEPQFVEPAYHEYVTIETELIRVVLSNAGANIISWQLNEHFDRGPDRERVPVEMIFSGDEQGRAFTLGFGGIDAQPVTSLFHVNRISNYSVEFYRYFFLPAGGHFRLTKRYDFLPNEYMFELNITMDGGHTIDGFNFGGHAYTLSFGPQIGPRFDRLDGRREFRNYVAFAGGRRRVVGLNSLIDDRPTWVAISGRYFSLFAIPLFIHNTMMFTDRHEPGLPSASRLHIMRDASAVSRISDVYRFYLGPKNLQSLVIYNTGANALGITNLQLTEEAATRGILAPLERVLSWLLTSFYGWIPNYGVAIILLTFLVKIVFFPLTRKSSEGMLKMQALAPKIKELQEKHKGNPQKLNAEMAAFYKSQNYNPISGCLPMLLQLPIFIAMFNLFNSHFELRNAVFIPGWIYDLSSAEYIWEFPEGVSIPLLGWTALRILPFIYVASQLLYGKVTQNPAQQVNPHMKMMLYLMPIVFFFVLYEMPSGLLVYWIFSNLLTLVQQVLINKFLVKKNAASPAVAAAAAPEAAREAAPVIAPKAGPKIAPKGGGAGGKKKKK